MANSRERSGFMGNNQGNNKRPRAKRGPWKVVEDKILIEYVKNHGERKWNEVQKRTNLKRSGKSCRLRWKNHLKPNLTKGVFTHEEENLIVELHKKFGNKSANIATQFPGRTDNVVKNYWNTKKKRQLKSNVPPHPEDVQKEIACNYKQNQLEQMQPNMFVVKSSHPTETPKPRITQQSNPHFHNCTSTNCQFPSNSNVPFLMFRRSSSIPSSISFHSHQNVIPSHWFEASLSHATNLSPPSASVGCNLLYYSNTLDSSFSVTNDDCLMEINSSYSHDNCNNAYSWFTQRNSGLLDAVVEECKNIYSREKGNNPQNFIMDKPVTSTSDNAKVDHKTCDTMDNTKLTMVGVFEDNTDGQQYNGGIDYEVFEDEELRAFVMNFIALLPRLLEW